MPAIVFPAPLALARLTDTLTPPGVASPCFEAKWDGSRCTVNADRLFSRNGTNLTPLFPDMAPVLAARLPADLVLDGELIAWNTTAADWSSPRCRPG